MTGITTRLVYVESAGDEALGESFAWSDGMVLAAAQHAERAQLHRELQEIIQGAEFDERTELGRIARCQDRLLLEIEAIPMAGATRRLTATIVVSVTRPDTGWADETAGEIAAILRGGEVEIATDRLARAFTEGWSRKPPFAGRRMTQALVAAGAALALAWLWMRGIGLARKRRRGPR
jgi:hypothetical protein